jgi:phospholipid-binding lipoprotein MlaA
MVLANNLLQLRFDAAATTLARFLTNSTVGGLGFYDVAATVGEMHQSGDFGQTLYVWGVRDTTYLVLPVLGPSTVRDGIGTGIGMMVPFGMAAMVPGRIATATSQVNTADAVGKPVADLSKVGMLQEMEASSLDFYAMLRSMSDQKRQAELQEALAQSLLSGSSQQGARVADPTQEPVLEAVQGPPPEPVAASQRQPAPEGRVGLGGQPKLTR